MRRLLLGLFLVACASPEASLESSSASIARAACDVSEPFSSFHKLGLVRGLPEAAAVGDGVLSPAVIEHEGVLHLWYAEKVGTKYTLFHSESRDGGESFSSPIAATGLGDAHANAYPTVWREDGTFKLIFGSGTFKVATSDDGVHFTLASAPILGASFVADRFDALSVVYPNRVADGDGAVLFFSGYDGRRVRIGRAVQNAEGSFVVDPPRPILDLGAATDFDNAAVAQSHVQRAFDQWWMLYGGYDTSRSSPGPYRIGMASSPDGLTWTKHGVALELSTNGTDAWSTRDPALVPAGDHWLLFYVGMGDDGRYRLHRATSDVVTPCSTR